MANNYTDSSFIVQLRDTKEQQAALIMLECLEGRDQDPEFTSEHWPNKQIQDLYDEMDIEVYGVFMSCEPEGTDAL